jgi:hypothetical protein
MAPISNDFEFTRVSEEQSKLDMTYQKGSETGSIAFTATSSDTMMTLGCLPETT